MYRKLSTLHGLDCGPIIDTRVRIVTMDSELVQCTVQVTTCPYFDQLNLCRNQLKATQKQRYQGALRHIYGVRHAYKENMQCSTEQIGEIREEDTHIHQCNKAVI